MGNRFQKSEYALVSVVSDSNLVLDEVVPEILNGQLLIKWMEADHIWSILQYKDMRWERLSAAYNIIGGVMIGLRVKLIWILVISGVRREKRAVYRQRRSFMES